MSLHREMFNVAAAYTGLSYGTGGPKDVHHTHASDPEIQQSLNVSLAENNPALKNALTPQF